MEAQLELWRRLFQQDFEFTIDAYRYMYDLMNMKTNTNTNMNIYGVLRGILMATITTLAFLYLDYNISRIRPIQDGTMIQTFAFLDKVRIIWRAVQRAKFHFPHHDFRKNKAIPMNHQIGGHPMWKHQYSHPQDGLRHFVLKPLQLDDRGLREVAFYEMIHEAVHHKKNTSVCMDDDDDDASSIEYQQGRYSLKVPIPTQGIEQTFELLCALKPFVPDYFGVVEHHSTLFFDRFTSHSKVVLSDIAAPFQHPCMLDLKMGRKTYEPDASQDKKERQRRKYPQQETFGFRIVGMKVYDPDHEASDPSSGYRMFEKGFGRQLKRREDVSSALQTFFKVKGSGASASATECTSRGMDSSSSILDRIEMVLQILELIQSLRQVMEECNNDIAFFATSTLIAYEGDDNAFSPDRFTLKLIDFAHVRYCAGGDPGFNHGLDTIMTFLEAIVRQRD